MFSVWFARGVACVVTIVGLFVSLGVMAETNGLGGGMLLLFFLGFGAVLFALATILETLVEMVGLSKAPVKAAEKTVADKRWAPLVEGLTIDQVKAFAGDPGRTSRKDDYVICTWPDVTVVFLDGRVTQWQFSGSA